MLPSAAQTPQTNANGRDGAASGHGSQGQEWFTARTDAEDPLAGAESRAWKVHQRMLQNTVEQIAIFVPAMLALAARVDAAHARLLPMPTALWCAGWLLFWISYRVQPVLRGPGFEWTLYSSVTAIGWVLFA